MSFSVYIHSDFRVIVASLCGALTWIMNQRYIDRIKKPVFFIVSFVMGILGSDLTLNVISTFMGCDLTGEEAIGAFICSALVITIITNTAQRISTFKK